MNCWRAVGISGDYLAATRLKSETRAKPISEERKYGTYMPSIRCGHGERQHLSTQQKSRVLGLLACRDYQCLNQC
jgi:hypothetical protein